MLHSPLDTTTIDRAERERVTEGESPSEGESAAIPWKRSAITFLMSSLGGTK
jgi:hypothetical protein